MPLQNSRTNSQNITHKIQRSVYFHKIYMTNIHLFLFSVYCPRSLFYQMTTSTCFNAISINHDLQCTLQYNRITHQHYSYLFEMLKRCVFHIVFHKNGLQMSFTKKHFAENYSVKDGTAENHKEYTSGVLLHYFSACGILWSFTLQSNGDDKSSLHLHCILTHHICIIP